MPHGDRAPDVQRPTGPVGAHGCYTPRMGEARRLPIDHPEFFDLPPPPGRSRESSIVLDGEGRFWHEGELVTHRGMADAFASWIRRHPRDGRYVLCNGYDWTYFRVEDVPFFVLGVGGSEARPTLRLSDQTQEPLDPAALYLGARDALYCSVKDGQYEARFTPAAQVALAPYLVEGPGGEPAFLVAGRQYVVGGRPGSGPARAGGAERGSNSEESTGFG